MTVPFEEIIRAWVLHYDERLPSNKVDRRQAFIILLGNLNDHGYTKDDMSTSKKRDIIKHCLNPNYKHKAKLQRWSAMLINDLEMAMLVYYGCTPIRTDVVTDEMKTKLEAMDKKAEESKALKTEDDPNDDGKEVDLMADNSALINIDTYKKNKFTNNDPKLVELTEEDLNKMSGSEGIWDDTMLKDLGIEFDE